MKVKHIIVAGGAWNHEIFGGAYRAATEFAEYLASRGHRVFYLAWTREKSFVNPVVHNGVEVWRYPAPAWRSPHPLNVIGHIRGSCRLVERICAAYPVDFLNGHDFLQFIGAFEGLRGRQVPTSFSVHSPLALEHTAQWGLSDNGCPRTLKQRLALRVLRCAERSVYRKAQVIQTDSRFTLGEISRDYSSVVEKKGVASPLWVDLARFRPASDRMAIRGRLGHPWTCNVPLFFTLRRLVPRMGIDNLIKAVSILNAGGYNCRLIIGGSGPEKESLERLVIELGLQEKVFMVGRISDELLTSCYQAADCFVLPTKALECFGLIILEAYACGTPVIATPVGSIPEVAGDIGRPLLAREASAEALAERMRLFILREIPWDAAAAIRYAWAFSFEERAARLSQVLFGIEVTGGKA